MTIKNITCTKINIILKRYSIVAFIFLFFSCTNAQNMKKIKDIVYVHDPVMIEQNGTYYMFNTGKGIPLWKSENMKDWKSLSPVFKETPTWISKAIPDFSNHLWAPDITFHNNQYYIYYSASAFGKNTSCIGVATNKTLETESPDYKWVDQGKVVQSIPGKDDWNAIDPNIAYDDDGHPWMSFGSFWNGMKLVRLNDDMINIYQPEEWYTIAKREKSFGIDIREPGDAAIEAPFIFRKNGFYYLFVSFDFCCRGLKSTYKIMVGRSENIEGPYIDKDGKRMDQGGGSLVLQGNENYSGVGHNSIYTFNEKDYLVYHGYDVTLDGLQRLLISPVSWDENKWPVATIPEGNDFKRIK